MVLLMTYCGVVITPVDPRGAAFVNDLFDNLGVENFGQVDVDEGKLLLLGQLVVARDGELGIGRRGKSGIGGHFGCGLSLVSRYWEKDNQRRRVSGLGFATEDGFTIGIQWPADSGVDNRRGGQGD